MNFGTGARSSSALEAHPPDRCAGIPNTHSNTHARTYNTQYTRTHLRTQASAHSVKKRRGTAAPSEGADPLVRLRAPPPFLLQPPPTTTVQTSLSLGTWCAAHFPLGGRSLRIGAASAAVRGGANPLLVPDVEFYAVPSQLRVMEAMLKARGPLGVLRDCNDIEFFTPCCQYLLV